jgi:signal transduction histidine kinase
MSADLSARPLVEDPLPPSEPPRPRRRATAWSRHRRELVVFIGIAVFVLVAVAAGTVLLSERIARQTAMTEAQTMAKRIGTVLVGPLLTDSQNNVPGRYEELNRQVRARVEDGSVSRMLVWNDRGTVIWSSDLSEVGDTLPTPTKELLQAVEGKTVSDIDPDPELTPPGQVPSPQVEVYTPITVAGDQMAFEIYLNYNGVSRQAAQIRNEIVPMAIGALVLLQLVQVPIAVSLARRVGRHENERTELAERILTASDKERRAIASDLHDGPVQDLAGVSYALSALKSGVAEQQRPQIDRLVGAVRNAVLSLRRLMVDIYPPDLSGPGLTAAVGDLVEPLRGHGLLVHYEPAPLPDMAPEVAAVVYRTAKETLSNVAQHAAARGVWVTLEETRLDGRPAVHLCVADDGIGFPETGIDKRTLGHLGLRLVVDRVEDLGGVCELGEGPDGDGARISAVLPLRPPPG